MAEKLREIAPLENVKGSRWAWLALVNTANGKLELATRMWNVAEARALHEWLGRALPQADTKAVDLTKNRL